MEQRFNIIQGEYKVSDAEDAVITTLLGSCVAACLYDPKARVGGMNHFLLPGDTASKSNNSSYGVYLMELLVNGLLKSGASRDRLQAKLFGGARTIQAANDIGESNATFAKRFLAHEGIAFAGGSLGGLNGRRIQFWPATGRARQSLITAYRDPPAPKINSALSGSGDVELF